MKKIYPNPEHMNLHIGDIVRKCVEDRGLSFRSVAKQLGISSTGGYHKFASPIYGNIYDLISLSKVLGKDVMAVIYNELHVRYPELFDYKEFHNIKQYANSKENDPLIALKKENDSLYALIKVLKANQKV